VVSRLRALFTSIRRSEKPPPGSGRRLLSFRSCVRLATPARPQRDAPKPRIDVPPTLRENANQSQRPLDDAEPRRVRRRGWAAAVVAARADRAEQRRRARATPAAAARMERHRRDWLRAYGSLETPPMPGPPDLARELWILVQLLVTDATGERVRWAARGLQLDGYSEAAGAGLAAATVPLGDGTHRYSLRGTGADARRARRVFAILWLLCQLERAGVVRGVSVCTLLRMVRDVDDGDPHCRLCGHAHPSRSAWNHRGPDATLETGDVGYGVALELAGAITRHQWRTPAQIAQHCEPWEIGDSGYPTNEYYIVGRDRVGRAADGGQLAPALIVQYAVLRDLAEAALDDTLPFVRAPYGSTAARRATQHAQAPP